MDGLTEGRIVHFVIKDDVHRPAIVVNNWKNDNQCEGYINLTVFTDGSNDLWHFDGPRDEKRDDEVRRGLWWVTSVCHSETKEPGTWHWIEKA